MRISTGVIEVDQRDHHTCNGAQASHCSWAFKSIGKIVLNCQVANVLTDMVNLHAKDNNTERGGEWDTELFPDRWPTGCIPHTTDAHERHAAADRRHHQYGKDSEPERSPRNNIILRCMDPLRAPRANEDKDKEVRCDNSGCRDIYHQKPSLNFKPQRSSIKTMRTKAPPTVITVRSGNPSIMDCEMKSVV